MSRVRGAATATALVLVLVLGACNPSRDTMPNLVESQAAAGTATIAVTAVEPWADVEDEMSPAFKLADGDAALSKVLPVTAVIQERILDYLGFGLSVGLPTETFTRTERAEKADDQPRTVDSKTVERTTTGGTATPQPVDPGARAAAALPLADLLSTGATLDPVLQYQTALALFQEVRTLNRYVRAAAMRYCFEPYVVRLQIGVTPYAKRQPYDVLTRVGFFPADIDRGPLLGEGPRADRNRPETTKNPCDFFSRDNPRIVPLLVTDNLELTRQQRTQDVVRQLRLALTGAVQGVAADANLQRLTDALEAVAGNSLNSITSVTRLSDNTVQARFGAVNDPSVDTDWGRSMVPRNYNVTLLMLVPRSIAENELPRVAMIAKTEMRDVRTGALLPPGREKAALARLPEIVRTYKLRGWEGLDDDELYRRFARLGLLVLANDTEPFCAEVQDVLGIPDNARRKDCLRADGRAAQADVGAAFTPAAVWAELAGLVSSFDLHSSSVQLPRSLKASTPPEQTVVLLDDRERATRARLRNGASFAAEEVVALLSVTTAKPLEGGPKDLRTYDLTAEGVAIVPHGDYRDLVLTFPSLTKFGLTNENLERACVIVTIVKDQRWATGSEKAFTRGPERDSGGNWTTESLLFAQTYNPQDAKRRTNATTGGPGPDAAKPVCTTSTICQGDEGCPERAYPAVWRQEGKPAEPAFKLSIPGGRRLVAPGATGSVRLAFDFGQTEGAGQVVEVVVDGAVVEGAEGAARMADANGVSFEAPPRGGRKQVDIRLNGLLDGADVAFTAQRKRGKEVLDERKEVLEVAVQRGIAQAAAPGAGAGGGGAGPPAGQRTP
jgi:hypothetical protein